MFPSVRRPRDFRGTEEGLARRSRHWNPTYGTSSALPRGLRFPPDWFSPVMVAHLWRP